MSAQKISESQLVDDLRRLADEFDRIPRARDINLHGKFSYETYQRRFGGIEEALEEAGFSAHNRVNFGPGTIGEKALLEDLRRMGSELGRPPKSTDIEDQGEFSLPTYYNYFENLADALSQAGFPAEKGNTIPNELLVKALRDVTDELGRPPATTTKVNEHCDYHMGTYRNRFGSLEEALAAAEVGNATEDQASP